MQTQLASAGLLAALNRTPVCPHILARDDCLYWTAWCAAGAGGSKHLPVLMSSSQPLSLLAGTSHDTRSVCVWGGGGGGEGEEEGLYNATEGEISVFHLLLERIEFHISQSSLKNIVLWSQCRHNLYWLKGTRQYCILYILQCTGTCTYSMYINICYI